MSPRYLRNEPDRKENITAALISGILAAGVGLVTFYFTRLILARDSVGEPEPGEGHAGAPGG